MFDIIDTSRYLEKSTCSSRGRNLNTYNSLIKVHCVSFRHEVTNLSYRLYFGVNFGIHRRNLLMTTRPLSVPWALWISSSSLFNSILNCSCMGTKLLSSSSFKNEYLFSGMMTFPPPSPLLLLASVSNRRASNSVFVFAVILLVSRYHRLFLATDLL